MTKHGHSTWGDRHGCAQKSCRTAILRMEENAVSTGTCGIFRHDSLCFSVFLVQTHDPVFKRLA
jgi:hypothetical protein